MNRSSRLALLTLSITLAACSALETDKVNYKSASKAPTLEIPPDLTQLARDNRYVVPGSVVSAAGQAQGAANMAGPATAPTAVGEVRIERSDNQRWLVVNQPAEKLWDTVKDFWHENGFTLITDKTDLGIMETEWAENRGKIPQDIIRRTIGRVLNALYDTGERDKFRTRLERNAAGGTEIYISHRGMVEVVADADKTRTVWQPRPSDPELEVEFLRRLMLKLGAKQEQTTTLTSTSNSREGPRVTDMNGQPVVLISEGFDRAWRRVGLALDRTGFTVEDRDRNQGIYFVRYVAPVTDKSEPGFFSKLFSKPAQASGPHKYRITVKSQGETSTVSILASSGEPAAPDAAQRILKLLADDLR